MVNGSFGLPRDPGSREPHRSLPLPELSREQSAIAESPEEVPPSWTTTNEMIQASDEGVGALSSEQRGLPPQRLEFSRSAAASRTEPKHADSENQLHPRRLPIAGDLRELDSLAKACTKCELHEKRQQTVFSRGSMKSGLVFVGEAPGEEEDREGRPFVGPAGQLLDKMIIAMGLLPDDVYICNIVKCRPPNNRRPSPTEIESCRPYLETQLELLKPKVIVALGGTAVAGLLGITEGITRVRGRFRLYDGRIAVMPTFHPAYLLRNPAAKREVWTDLRQVLRHLGPGPAPHDPST